MVSFEVLNWIDLSLRYEPSTGRLLYRVRHGSFRPGDCAGYVRADDYLALKIAGRNVPAHHVCWYLATGNWPRDYLDIDHINRVRSDNRLANLREVTRSVNLRNRLFRNRSGHTGIHARGDRWVAQVGYGGRTHHLGTFSTLDEALRVRVAVVEGLST